MAFSSDRFYSTSLQINNQIDQRTYDISDP